MAIWIISITWREDIDEYGLCIAITESNEKYLAGKNN